MSTPGRTPQTPLGRSLGVKFNPQIERWAAYRENFKYIPGTWTTRAIASAFVFGVAVPLGLLKLCTYGQRAGDMNNGFEPHEYCGDLITTSAEAQPLKPPAWSDPATFTKTPPKPAGV